MMGQTMGNPGHMLLSTVLQQSRPAQQRARNNHGRQGPGSHGHPKGKAAMFPGNVTCFAQVSLPHKLYILAIAHPVEWNPVQQGQKSLQDVDMAFIVGFDRFPGSGLEERLALISELLL